MDLRALHRAAHHAAALLQHAGIGRGDCVVLRAANSPEWTAFFLGAMLRGATVAPIDHDARPELIERIRRHCRCQGIRVRPGGSDRIPFVDIHSLSLDRPAPREDVVVPVTPADPAIVFFTSGTTAQPRGVVLTHANLVAQIAGFRRWRFMARPVGWRMLVMAPLSHAQGLVVGVVLPLSFGLSVIYTHSSNPGHLIRLLRDNRVALFSTLPRVLHVLRQSFLSQPVRHGPGDAGRETDTHAHLGAAAALRVHAHAPGRRLQGTVGRAGRRRTAAESRRRFLARQRMPRRAGLRAHRDGRHRQRQLSSHGTLRISGRAPADTEVRIADDGEILVRGAMVSPALSRRPAAGHDRGRIPPHRGCRTARRFATASSSSAERRMWS